MFKSNKKSSQGKRAKGPGGGAALMEQLGLQIPNFNEANMDVMGDDDDDEALEAELKLMQQDVDSPASKRSKANQKKSGKPVPDLQAFHNDVNKILNDIDRPINDDELSDVDEEELLAELHGITGEMETDKQQEHVEKNQVPSTSNSNSVLSLLESRRDMYTKAVQSAKTSGDSAKTRRLDRQLNLIKELIQSVKSGAPINESEIPPELSAAASSSSKPVPVLEEVPIRAPSPPPPKSSMTSLPKDSKPNTPQQPVSVPSSNNTDEAIAQLKSLALKAKAAGDMTKAKEYLIQMKQLQSEVASNAATKNPPVISASAQIEMPNNVSEDENSVANIVPLKAPQPTTVMEALQQRHEELVKRHQEAVSKGESSKARRMDRLTKQYEEAIDATKKGRPFDYSELADLPGFAPIPLPQAKTQAAPPPAAAVVTSTVSLAPVAATKSEKQVRPSLPVDSTSQKAGMAASNTEKNPKIQTLRLRKEELQKRALEAKRQGDIETAKKHLIASKEIDKEIASLEAGLSTNINPILESPDKSYDIVLDDELTQEIAQSDRDTIYRRLQDDLLRQMQLCARNQQIYAQMEGADNLKYANEFKHLEQRCAHDLERLKKSFQNGSKAPTFHYEKRQLNIIQINNDLSDYELELNILRGVNLRVPSGYSATSLETYVNIEFPYPSETPQTARTRHGTGSAIVEYPDSVNKFQIKRNDNRFKRLITRKDLKLSIFHKVGFLRSDRLLGIASVKLAPLEQMSTIHEFVHVYENDHKKKPEGKLEVKIRIKEALGQAKSSELSSQQWLVIDRFEEISKNNKQPGSKSPSTTSSITAISKLVPTTDALGLLALNLANNINNNTNENDDDMVVDTSRSSNVESKHDSQRNSSQPAGFLSIQVLRHEADLIKEQIVQLEDHLTQDQLDQLRAKEKELVKQSDEIVENLRQGGKKAVLEHVQGLQQLMKIYDEKVEEYRQKDDKKKADMVSKKKELVAKEIETLTHPA